MDCDGNDLKLGGNLAELTGKTLSYISKSCLPCGLKPTIPIDPELK